MLPPQTCKYLSRCRNSYSAVSSHVATDKDPSK